MDELDRLVEFLEDEDFAKAVSKVRELIRKPDVAINDVAKTIVGLQAISAKMAMLAAFYTTIGAASKEDRHRKNIYYSARDAISGLVDALKYYRK